MGRAGVPADPSCETAADLDSIVDAADRRSYSCGTIQVGRRRHC
jgi:hypothetical protein